MRKLAELGERGARSCPPNWWEKFRSADVIYLFARRLRLAVARCPLPTLVGAVERLAAADAAAAWCAMIQSTSPAFTGAYLDPAAAAEVFAAGGDTVLGGVYAPLGRAATAPGGYRVSGRWPFASGSGHCTWLDRRLPRRGRPTAAPAVSVVAGGHDPRHLARFRPLRLREQRHRGQGSVRTGRLARIAITTERPVVEGPLYRFPVFGLLALGIAAVALGIRARGDR